MKSQRSLAILAALAVAASGCSVMRGIPTHGGGKRFDEEQRVVSGAIRRAVADMDLNELQGKAVQINTESVSHTGGGYVSFPGIQGISAGWNANESKSSADSITVNDDFPVLPYAPLSVGTSYGNSEAWSYNLGASYSPHTNYSPSMTSTDPDINYLKADLTMKAQHSGLNVVGANPEATLFVLIDVLGTNRSRRDSLVYWTDTLLASCEITYYAVDAKTSKLLFRARQTAATGEYDETSALGFAAFRVRRGIQSVPPSPFPVDGNDGREFTAGAAVAASSPTATPPKATSETLRQAASQSVDNLLNNAETQMQIGNLGEARRLIDSARAVDPDYPYLSELESRLMRKAQSVNAPK